MKEPKFKDYKQKQKYYKARSEVAILFYDSGKKVTKKGVKKGTPFVNEEKRALKEERRLRKLQRKAK